MKVKKSLKTFLKYFAITFLISFATIIILITLIFFVSIFFDSNRIIAWTLMVILSIIAAIYLHFLFKKVESVL